MLRQLTVLAVAVSGTAFVAIQPAQAVEICNGEAATIVSSGPGNDDVTGTSGRDVIVVSGGGYDVVHAGAGGDLICMTTIDDQYAEVWSERGDDTVLVDGEGTTGVAAGDGDDTVSADGAGTAYVNGQDGADRLTSTADNVLASGGPGNDVLRGGPGRDGLSGGPGADRLFIDGEGYDSASAGPGNDRVRTGGASTDEVRLGSGDDVLLGSNSHLHYDKSKGRVVVDLTRGRAVGEGTDQVTGVVELSGSAFGDRLIGTSGPDRLNGEAGNDRLEAGAGDDYLDSGPGRDVVLAGSGKDQGRTFVNDDVWLGAGDDDVITSLGTRVRGGYGTDSIRATQPRTGTLVSGGPGVDGMRIVVQLPTTTTVGVRVNLATGRAVAGEWVFEVTGIEQVTGTRWADTLLGDGLANVLVGLGGDDTINGRGGIDIADGGEDIDSCIAETVLNCES